MANQKLKPTFSIIDVLNTRIKDQSLKKTERTEFRLMKSIAELLDKNSFRQIRNIDISKNAGVSYGVLNARFKDKTELATRLAAYYAEKLETAFNHGDPISIDDDVYIMIVDQIHYHFKCYQNNRCIWRLFMESDVRGEEIDNIFDSANRHWAEKLIAVLPKKIADKAPSTEEKELIGVILSGMFDEVIRQFYLHVGVDKTLRARKAIEWIALLRHRAIMGKDPSLESMERAHLLLSKRGVSD